MLSAYRDTYHLSAHEMDHLRSCLFWGRCEMGNLSEYMENHKEEENKK